MKFLPVARNKEIIVQNLHNETLIYNLKTNQAFCLNETAAKIFDHCDGKTTFDELKEKHQLTDDLIYLALDGLKKENLIEDAYVSPFAGMNRRDVIRKVGLASMIALPVISSLVAPTASSAASGGSCTTGICIPAGQNICAGCAGLTVTFDFYSSGSGCTGAVQTANFNNNCPGNASALTSGFDRIRKSHN